MPRHAHGKKGKKHNEDEDENNEPHMTRSEKKLLHILPEHSHRAPRDKVVRRNINAPQPRASSPPGSESSSSRSTSPSASDSCSGSDEHKSRAGRNSPSAGAPRPNSKGKHHADRHAPDPSDHAAVGAKLQTLQLGDGHSSPRGSMSRSARKKPQGRDRSRSRSRSRSGERKPKAVTKRKEARDGSVAVRYSQKDHSQLDREDEDGVGLRKKSEASIQVRAGASDRGAEKGEREIRSARGSKGSRHSGARSSDPEEDAEAENGRAASGAKGSTRDRDSAAPQAQAGNSEAATVRGRREADSRDSEAKVKARVRRHSGRDHKGTSGDVRRREAAGRSDEQAKQLDRPSVDDEEEDYLPHPGLQFCIASNKPDALSPGPAPTATVCNTGTNSDEPYIEANPNHSAHRSSLGDSSRHESDEDSHESDDDDDVEDRSTEAREARREHMKNAFSAKQLKKMKVQDKKHKDKRSAAKF